MKHAHDLQMMNMQDAISVIETDCEVDFAPPLDYVEPSRELPEADEPMDAQDEAGPSNREEEGTEPKFQAFVGAGRRLDGKASTAPVTQPAASSSTRKTGHFQSLSVQ